jgi:hypothetical protein
MHGTKRASTDLLLYDILIYSVDGAAIILAVRVRRLSMQCLFDLAWSRYLPLVMPQRTFVAGKGPVGPDQYVVMLVCMGRKTEGEDRGSLTDG